MSAVYRLWAGGRIRPENLPLLPCVTQAVVHRASGRHYQFLLGADIAAYAGELFCGWGNSVADENDAGSIMAGRRSVDGGYSWGEFEKIAVGDRDRDACSHGVFFPCRDNLYVLAPRAGYRADYGDLYPGLRVEMLRLDNRQGGWKSEGIVIDREPFWPMGGPRLMTNGNYIMPGIICRAHRAEPAVALCRHDDIRSWRIVRPPIPERKDTWAEGGLLIDGSEIRFLFRNGWKHCPRAQIAVSHDYGESWEAAMTTNLPMAPAKPCCGTLSDGRIYAVFNPAGNGRNTLALAISDPGERVFRRIWRLQHGESPQPRFNGIGKGAQWAYPLACEFDRKLYVVYAAAKEDCVLSIIPLTALG